MLRNNFRFLNYAISDILKNEWTELKKGRNLNAKWLVGAAFYKKRNLSSMERWNYSFKICSFFLLRCNSQKFQEKWRKVENIIPESWQETELAGLHVRATGSNKPSRGQSCLIKQNLKLLKQYSYSFRFIFQSIS